VLAWLAIEGLALVESVELEFHRGLNVLTGETGAGKSVVLGSIGLLLGGRADADWVRSGRDRGSVEGTFDLAARPDLLRALEELGVECGEGRVILRREVSRDGRSRAFVNGRSVLLPQIRAVGDLLLDLHGQHEHQQLLRRDVQADFYDAWAGVLGERRGLEAEAAAVRGAAQELARMREVFERDRSRADELREDFARLEAARLEPGEEARLREERDRLKHRERELEALADARRALVGEEEGAEAGLRRAARTLRSLAAAVPADVELADLADAALAQAQELVARLDEARDRALEEPLWLDAVEERLDVLHRLKRRHAAPDIEALIGVRESLRGRVAALDPDGRALAAQERDVEARTARFGEALEGLVERRAARYDAFTRAVGSRLAKLGFSRAALRARPTDSDRARPASDPLAIPGLEFEFQPNEGEAPRPLSRIASGGELSRVMLAIKSLLAEHDRVASLVFDEVDQGIGGAVGEEVGRLLQNVSNQRQVLCITHLPLLAAHGARHFVVAKDAVKGRTETSVRPLAEPERVDEIARLLAGDRVSETTRKQARELLRAAAEDVEEPGAPGAAQGARAGAASRTTRPAAAGTGKVRRSRSA
jgi:DNA repair protein RecN (Recombination protein N)